MKEWLRKRRRGYGKKLNLIHAWNGWIVLFLALSGLILVSAFWRERLGEGRVWIKWLHIGGGLLLLAPVIYYLLLAAKHWRQLKGRPLQKINVIIVLTLLAGWLLSGIVLWLHRMTGPAWANIALTVHDLLTWIGLPYIIYHSITRVKWLKQPQRRTIIVQGDSDSLSGHRPLYSRRVFVKWSVIGSLMLIFGPSFLQFLGKMLRSSTSMDYLLEKDANHLVPAPMPLPASDPPTGGGSKGNFRVYSVTPIPEFDNTNWSFTVDGLVNTNIQWNWSEFVKLGRNVQVSDFHCVTGWSVYNNTWEGLPLKDILRIAGVKSGAGYVKFYSGDGVYTDALSMDQALMDDVMVAVMHDGKPIPSDLGGPVRLIVPQMYAYKSVKWLNRIELIEEDHIGYWEQRGYSKDAWVASKDN